LLDSLKIFEASIHALRKIVVVFQYCAMIFQNCIGSLRHDDAAGDPKNREADDKA
jgi:hypothetical protein